MPRSDEAEWWFNAVYEAVQEIPPGRVTSYGHIARLLGRRGSRHESLNMLETF
jgi:methylated-DNA-protein-cysteine methyltransferase-like protein